MINFIKSIINYYSILIFLYFIFVNIFYILIIFVSLKRLKAFVRIIRADMTPISGYTKPISIIVPAYNEEDTVIDNIHSLLHLDYPELEVILVNDGSKDHTLEKIISHFQLRKIDMELNIQIPCELIRGVYSSFDRPNLVVVDKENGGKSDALNAGVNVSKYPLFCAIDADCIIEKDALLRIVKPFLKYENTIAVGGIIRIANGCQIKNGVLIKAGLPRKMIERFQIIEYLRAFLTSRVGWERLNSLLIISGAFGLFKKSAVVAAGGYNRTIGEDMELTLRMHKYFRKHRIPYKVDFASDAVCWTQAPDSIQGLKNQRIRWHRGLVDSIVKNKEILLNPKYGKVGMLAVPYFVFIEMVGPIVEMIGYIIIALALYFKLLSSTFLYIFLMAYMFGIFFSFAAIGFEQISYKRYKGIKEILLLFFYSLFEQFFYRQLTVWWRVKSYLNFKKGSKQWGSIKRKSF